MKKPTKITSGNKYGPVYGKMYNCTAFAHECVYKNSGKYPSWSGNPYIKGNATTIWDYKDGFSQHQLRSKALIGQVMIFKHKTDPSHPGHVEFIYDKDNSYIYTWYSDWYTGETGKKAKHLLKPQSPHPKFPSLELVGFRGTHASLKYQQENNN